MLNGFAATLTDNSAITTLDFKKILTAHLELFWRYDFLIKRQQQLAS